MGFNVNIDPPANCWISKETEIILVEVAVSAYDKRSDEEFDTVVFFAMPNGYLPYEIEKKTKDICESLGLGVYTIYTTKKIPYKFDTMRQFLSLSGAVEK